MEANPVKQVDIDLLKPQLTQLIAAYHDALKFVEQQPFRIGRLTYEIKVGSADSKPEDRTPLNPQSESTIERQWVVPRFARLFIESHIHNRLCSILRQLHIEQLVLTDEKDKRQAQIKGIVEQLEKNQAMLFNWGRLRKFVSASSVFPTLLAILTPILPSQTGLNISSISDFMSSAISLVESSGEQPLLSFIYSILYLLLIVYVLIVPITIQYGFHFRRAILSGGCTFDSPASNRKDYELRVWQNFPSVNIYRLETDIFQLLGIRKNTEFPLDLTIAPFPYLLFVITVVFTTYLIQDIGEGDTTIAHIGLVLTMWLALIFKLQVNRVKYRARKSMGNL